MTTPRRPGSSQYETLDSQDFGYDPSLPQHHQNEPSPAFKQDSSYDPSPLQQNQHESSPAFKQQSRTVGDKKTIYIALACILVPMLGLSALLIGLVFGYRVKVDQSTIGPLALTQESDTDNSAYYVYINSTTFATIASWSSTIAPLLVVAIMSMFSFPVARNLKEKSSVESPDLPTPSQLSLLIETLTGSVMSVWTFVRYRRRPGRPRVASLVRTALLTLVLATVVGYAIAGIDTWLHLVMDTVEINMVVSSDSSTQLTFSRGIEDPMCSNQTVSDFDIENCTVSLATTGTFLMGGNNAYRTLANVSNIDTVRRAHIDNKTLAYLGPADIPARFDYQASTFAMHTQCTPIGAKCNLRATSGATEPFHCTDAFFGDLPSRTINGDTEDPYSGLSLFTANTGIVFYKDAGLTQYANASFKSHVQNPYYMGVWAYPLGITSTPSLVEDGNVVVPYHGGVTWLLSCTATTYEMTYSWVNGSVTVDDLTIANGTTGSMLASTIYYGFGKSFLDSIAYGASGAGNPIDLADSYAYGYSRTALALVAGVMAPRDNLQEQRWEKVLVARVPKAPLYLLLVGNLGYAILGVVLAVLALGAERRGVGGVREMVSVKGLVKTGFGEDEGRATVGVEREAGRGWVYVLKGERKVVP